MPLLRPGDRFGRLRITGLLGQGGMGAVYAAVDDAVGRTVALKVVLPELVAGDPTALERFRREARAAAALAHPHVVTLLAVEQDRAGVGLAFELVPGGSLKDRLAREGRLPWREAARLVAEAARGLAAIHAAGLVHRDVKPHNLLVDAAGRVKVSDLGLVRPGPGGPARSLTATGQLLGTLEYLAPEGQGEGPVGPPADLYALGATLHHLVAGRPPFPGSGYAQLKQHAFDPPPPLRGLAPDVPPDLEALVLRLLAKDPAARGPSAAVVADELEALLRAPRARPRRGGPGGLALGAAAAVVVVAAAATAGAVAARGSGGPAPSAPAPPAPTPPAPAPPAPATPTPAGPRALSVERTVLPPWPAALDRTVSYRTLSLTADGRHLLVGGGFDRPIGWILDAATLVVEAPCPLAGAVADPSEPAVYGSPRAGALVKVDLAAVLDHRPGDARWSAPAPGPDHMGVAVAVDATRDLVFAGWQNGYPDPVSVVRRADGGAVTTLLLPDSPTASVVDVHSAGGHTWLSWHRGAVQGDHDFVLALVDHDPSLRVGLRFPGVCGATVDADGVLLGKSYATERVVTATASPQELYTHAVGFAAGALGPLPGGRRVVRGTRGALEVFTLGGALVATAALRDREVPSAVLVDLAGRRALALVVDPSRTPPETSLVSVALDADLLAPQPGRR